MDCAFTVAFNPRYDNLLQAVKEATNTGIKVCIAVVRNVLNTVIQMHDTQQFLSDVAKCYQNGIKCFIAKLAVSSDHNWLAPWHAG